jgi:hypothetical protein
MPLSGTIWPAEESTGQSFDFEDVDFISLVSNNTYGKPPIIAPGTEDFTSAEALDRDVTVLYVNPANIAAVKVTKTA